MACTNPFTSVDEPAILGPGTLDMALPLVDALRLHPGMRVLEVGGGTGQVATILAKAWDVTVFTLEPWHGGEDIQARAAAVGVTDRVVALTSRAQDLPFAADTFDGVLSINSFEMIGDERPAALAEMVRVVRPGARVGIAEPMCLPAPIPPEIAELDERGRLRFQQCFRTVAWNRDLFTRAGLLVTQACYFPEARPWWLAYEAQATQPGREVECELIRRDEGRWLSLGLVVGEKPVAHTAAPTRWGVVGPRSTNYSYAFVRAADGLLPPVARSSAASTYESAAAARRENSKGGHIPVTCEADAVSNKGRSPIVSALQMRPRRTQPLSYGDSARSEHRRATTGIPA